MGATLPHMANDSLPGEQPGKLEALLDRWQISLDLHARYAALDDARYWHVQPWPKHERPQRWIIQLARKRILALKRIVAQRLGRGRSRLHRRHRDHGFPRHAGRDSPRWSATFRSPRRKPSAAKCSPRSPTRSKPAPAARAARPRAAETRAVNAMPAHAPASTGAPPRPRARCRRCPIQKPSGWSAAARAGAPPKAAAQAPQVRREPRREAQRPVAAKPKKVAVDDHADRTRGHRRRGALVRLGPPMARDRRDDRASRGTPGAVGDPPHPAHLPRPHRRHRDKASRLSTPEALVLPQAAACGLREAAALAQNLRPDAPGELPGRRHAL